MWIFSQMGFFSVVKKADGYYVRARREQDLKNLGLIPVPSYPGSDYPFRTIITDEVEWRRLMDHFASSVDYPNFKGRIGKLQDQRARIHHYHTIWSIMANEND